MSPVADWRLARSIYAQCSTIIGDSESTFLPDALVGFLSQALGRLTASYADGPFELALDALDQFSQAEGGGGRSDISEFSRLYHDQRLQRFVVYSPPSGRRRRPTPFESTVETARRLRDATEVTRAFTNVRSAALLGGSTSYGRFFNVKGGRLNDAASDLDFLLVLDTYQQLHEAVQALRSVDGADSDSLDRMSHRVEVFSGLSPGDLPRIFSHKIDLWTLQSDNDVEVFDVEPAYKVSLHVFDLATFEYLLLHDMPVVNDCVPQRRQLEDYRESQPDRNDHQRSFAGIDLRLEREFDQVEDGFLTQSTVFFINDGGQYFPGMFQNLVLPAFHVQWDHLWTATHRAEEFRWKMIERLREERRARPHEFLRLSLSHTRSEIFAPAVIRAVDEGLRNP